MYVCMYYLQHLLPLIKQNIYLPINYILGGNNNNSRILKSEVDVLHRTFFKHPSPQLSKNRQTSPSDNVGKCSR